MFKTKQTQVLDEPKEGAELDIVKFEDEHEQKIEDFSFQKISVAGEKDYQNVKKKYGPIASTDSDRVIKHQKDARFSVSPLLKSALHIDQEEKKVIEKMVQDRISEASDEAQRKASEKGYAEGFEKAQADAMEQFRQDIGDKTNQIEELLASFEKAKIRIFEENEKFILDMIFNICRTILFREVEEDKEYVKKLSKELIERIGVRDNITLKVHQSNMDNLADIKKDLFSQIADLKNINIITDPEIKAGGCIVESEWSAVNATIDTQIKKIYESTTGRQMQEIPEEKSTEEEVQAAVETVESEVKTEVAEKSQTPDTNPEDSTDE